jgi:all-trans-8'-apo-beta-carotenal 15,15'-oxygenase
VESYDFGLRQYCTEPVFVPRPGLAYETGSGEEPGWLLTLVYDGNTKRSYLAVLAADALADGPLARVHLRHHVPFSFHGYWHAEA